MPGALEVIAAGELFIDLIMSGIEGWPEPGKEVLARHFHREIGGGAVITACGLAKLGSRSAVLGVAGVDTGDWVVNRLASNAVDPSMIQFDAVEPTAFTVIATSPNDRAFLTYSGANRNFQAEFTKAVEARKLAGTRHVHLAWAPDLDTAGALLNEIRGSGCTVSLDVGWREKWLADPRAIAILRRTNFFFPNEIEARLVTGEKEPRRILQGFADRGISRVALKRGSAGSALLWDGRMFFAGPHPVAALDTTGAGDCFDAGFLHAWLKGQDPESCLRTANACGAISTEAYGGIVGFPSLERLERELSKAHA